MSSDSAQTDSIQTDSIRTVSTAGTLSSDRPLLWFLYVIGGVSLLAFLAALMPALWIIQAAEALGFDPFPDSPLTFYLARNLSLLYGFVGATLLVISSDLERYRPLIRYASIGTILFGLLQWTVDSMSGLPGWWSYGESISTLCGGTLFYWLQRRASRGVEVKDSCS